MFDLFFVLMTGCISFCIGGIVGAVYGAYSESASNERLRLAEKQIELDKQFNKCRSSLVADNRYDIEDD